MVAGCRLWIWNADRYASCRTALNSAVGIAVTTAVNAIVVVTEHATELVRDVRPAMTARRVTAGRRPGRGRHADHLPILTARRRQGACRAWMNSLSDGESSTGDSVDIEENSVDNRGSATLATTVNFEWTRRDLNPGPLPCQGSDLPLIYEPSINRIHGAVINASKRSKRVATL